VLTLFVLCRQPMPLPPGPCPHGEDLDDGRGSAATPWHSFSCSLSPPSSWGASPCAAHPHSGGQAAASSASCCLAERRVEPEPVLVNVVACRKFSWLHSSSPSLLQRRRRPPRLTSRAAGVWWLAQPSPVAVVLWAFSGISRP
jgi:hypothetical protein